MRPFVSANAAAAAAAAGAVPHSASAGAVAAQYECRCECRCECRLAAIAAGSYWQRLATIGAGLGPSALLSQARLINRGTAAAATTTAAVRRGADAVRDAQDAHGAAAPRRERPAGSAFSCACAYSCASVHKRRKWGSHLGGERVEKTGSGGPTWGGELRR